jgi:hypothetical protein
MDDKTGRLTHHLELFPPAEVDDEVHGWLRESWNDAALPRKDAHGKR